MGFLMQATLAKTITFEGIGVHSGAPARLRVLPAMVDHGIVFVRVDLEAGKNEIPARYDLVVNTQLCTELSNEYGAKISTVEHLMAALAGCGIDNARIEIDGAEIPIMDGSSQAFVKMIVAVGVILQAVPRRSIRILRPVHVQADGKTASLLPADYFTLDVSISFVDPAIGNQSRILPLFNGTFVKELANARTFGRMQDITLLRAQGLARGGSLSNAIIVDHDKILNKEGLRFTDEFVRHKMLDVVGDLALAGAPILGLFQGYKMGHDLTNQLLRQLFAQPDAWEYCEVSRDLCMGLCLTTSHAICA